MTVHVAAICEYAIEEAAASHISLVILPRCLWHFVTSSSYQQCLFEQVYAPPTRLHLCVGYCSSDRAVRQTDKEFLKIAAHIRCLAVALHSLSFLSYLTDRQEQVCSVPPAQFHTMTCVCLRTAWESSGQQVLKETAMRV